MINNLLILSLERLIMCGLARKTLNTTESVVIVYIQQTARQITAIVTSFFHFQTVIQDPFIHESKKGN